MGDRVGPVGLIVGSSVGKSTLIVGKEEGIVEGCDVGRSVGETAFEGAEVVSIVS